MNIYRAKASGNHLMTAADPDYTEIGCTFDAVVVNLTPFYLAAAAGDNLRLSMRVGLSESKILRYRIDAYAPDRSAEKCRTTLHQMQALRQESKPAAAASPAQRQASGNSRIFNDMSRQLVAMRTVVPPENAATAAPGRGGP